jgi:hypothetical protein
MENQCELPDEPDIMTVLLYEEFAFMNNYKKDQYQKLKDQLTSWETIFYLPLPKDPLTTPQPNDIAVFQLGAYVLLSRDGGFKWSKQYIRTENGIVGIYENLEKSVSSPFICIYSQEQQPSHQCGKNMLQLLLRTIPVGEKPTPLFPETPYDTLFY